MIELLARLFIRGRDALAPSALRRAYGQLCGAVGIGLNLLLFAVKFLRVPSADPSPSPPTPSTTYPMQAPHW